MLDSILNFLLFGCTHKIISRPMSCRVTCLNCGCYYFNNFQRVGAGWHRPKPSRVEVGL